MDAVSYGWKKFTENIGPFLGLTAILLVLAVVVQLGTTYLTTGSLIATGGDIDPDTGLPENYLVTQLVSLMSSFVVGIISWVIGLALMRGALDVVDTGRTDMSAMFTRIPWGQAIVAGLLVSLATLVGTVMCILPGIIIGFLLYYSSVAVLDGNSAVDAISASFRFTTGNLGPTVLLFLLGVLGVVLSICTCGLGVLVVTPVMTIAVAYTWRVLQGRPVSP